MTKPAPKTVRDLRREQIVAAARRLVAEKGLSALTIGALERELHFTRGVITYHFEGKDDIVMAVLESAIREIDAAAVAEVQSSATPEERIHAIISSMVRGFLDNVEAGKVLLSFWGRLGTDRRAARVNAALYQRYRAEAAAVIRSGQKAGAFGPGDADTVATIVVALVIGIATQAYFEEGAIDIERATWEAAACVRARLAKREPARRARR